MNRRQINLNTIILLALLLVILGGAIMLISATERVVRPIEQAREIFETQVGGVRQPTPTIIADPTTIIREVQGLSRLETASYSVEKVITAESGQGALEFLFGDRLILVAHGQVIAGVDLSQLTEDDIVVGENGTVVMMLPAPEILVVNLDNQKSYVYDRETGLIGQNPALETEARRAAEDEILDAALEDGILDMAQRNAELYVARLLLALGFSDVRFTEPALETPTPFSTP